jgi:hypothetical protein
VKGFDEKWLEDTQRRISAGMSKDVPAVFRPDVAKKVYAKELPCPLEEAEQVALAQFLDLYFWDQWAHIPNGGMRPSSEDKDGRRFSVEAKKLKAQGVKKGVPDNFIFRPVKGAFGVVVELKRVRGGVVSPDQKKWLKTLAEFGWICYVARGAEDGIRFVREQYGI